MSSRGWEGVTADQLTRKVSVPKKSKYRNTKTTLDGQSFDSKAEAEEWLKLKARERAGEIRNLRRQVRWPLHAPIASCPGAIVQIAEYVSDFEWDEKMHIDAIHYRHVVCDKKGHKTAGYLLKKRWLFLEYGIEIQEV